MNITRFISRKGLGAVRKYDSIKYYRRLLDGEKIPRKAKKAILGTRINKSKLKRMAKEFKVIYKQKHIYESSVYNMEPFCPECGCTFTMSTGNMAEYPELWEKIHCARCGFLVAKADNSVYYHALEFDDFRICI